MEGYFIKKTAVAGAITLLLLFLTVYLNNQQQPEASDVLNSTEDWSPRPGDVLAIEHIDQEWIAFFKDNEKMYVGYLQQNWLGQWTLVDELGNEGTIGVVTFNPDPEEGNGLVWGASGLFKGSKQLFSYYYGMVSNSAVDEVTLSIGKREPEKVPFFKRDGERFFFIKKESEKTVPFEYKALSDGKVIGDES